jgi:Zn-dependent protease
MPGRRNLMLGMSLREILIIVPTILIALTVHELSHAAAALALGDDTAREQGRITLNPLKHIDPIGFIFIILAGFGWAKPVVFAREKLRHPVRDEILIAYAEPVSNLVLAFAATLVLKLGLNPGMFTDDQALRTFIEVLSIFVGINTGLAVFNALPIPPLDGSHVYTSFLTEWNGKAAEKVLRYGFFVLIGIIVLERTAKIDILPIGRITEFIFGLMLRIVGIA